MSVCEACGADINNAARFCGECGAVVQDPPGAAPGGKTIAPPKARTTKGQGPRKDVREVLRDGKGRGGKPPEAAAGPAPAPAPQLAAPGAALTAGPSLRTTVKGISAPAPPLPALEPMSVKTPSPAAARPASSSAAPVVPTPPASDREGKSEFQRLLDEVESGFDAILVVSDSNPPTRPKGPAEPADDDQSVTTENRFDQQQAMDLFQQLVVANAQPIRDFMIDVRLGEPHKAWLDHCEPAIQAILRSAKGMGFAELVGRATRFIEAIHHARAATAQGAPIRGEPREQLMDAYNELIAFFPEAFGAEVESNRREAAIVGALLSKVPGLHPLALGRIYGTGLVSLGLFYVSRPGELAELVGVSLEIAERITERFREYRQLASAMSPADARAEERRRLRLAMEELSRADRAYEAAAPATTERRVFRRERSLAMADITIYLARLGEVDRLKKIETMSFAARVDALAAYLEEADRKAVLENRAR